MITPTILKTSNIPLSNQSIFFLPFSHEYPPLLIFYLIPPTWLYYHPFSITANSLVIWKFMLLWFLRPLFKKAEKQLVKMTYFRHQNPRLKDFIKAVSFLVSRTIFLPYLYQSLGILVSDCHVLTSWGDSSFGCTGKYDKRNRGPNPNTLWDLGCLQMLGSYNWLYLLYNGSNTTDIHWTVSKCIESI